ncbi:hypothetical protein [Thauera butanivorans]|uniref:hypothetical protein n=1 Tax=Thauera butanivorans TaxID=86174 RepID=UPI000837F8EF|nr:hypothetical protein [Thauera butanivorans]
MTIIHDNRRCAISVEEHTGSIRFLRDVDPAATLPPFVGKCTYTRLSESEVIITGLAGNGITRAHLRLIVRWAHGAGYHWLYARRLPGHTLPMATLRRVRPLQGWYEVDIDRVIKLLPRPD